MQSVAISFVLQRSDGDSLFQFYCATHFIFALYLLPPPRDPELLTRLRAPTKFPRSSNRTKKYQSSMRYGLSKFQTG